MYRKSRNYLTSNIINENVYIFATLSQCIVNYNNLNKTYIVRILYVKIYNQDALNLE